ncbi:MAG: replication initiation protein [Gammaproteobacteria bacterium]|nr:replication initiation protein [Gammaproteobacteria bacterium]
MGRNVTAVGCVKKEIKKELKKHAATIHCSNTLTLLQRKITNALLYHAYKELMSKVEHEITIKELCRLIGYNGHNHGAIKDALRELISTVIEWNLIDDKTGAENWTASSIIASVCLEGPLCYYAYSPRMKQLLHSPSMFGKIDLVIQSRFRSSYGLALYENCIRYRGLPKTKWFDLDLFKKLMGVPPGKYAIFRDFKRRVLDKAIDEVNTYSDLVIAAELVREGRKIARLRFTLKERAKKTRLGKSDGELLISAESHSLKMQLSDDFLLSAKQVQVVLREYESQYIQNKIDMIKASKTFQSNKIDNVAGYLLSALRQDYQTVDKAPIDMKLQATHVLSLEIQSLKKEIEGIWLDYHRYRDEAIYQAIDSLGAAKKKLFMSQFYQFAEPTLNTVLSLQRTKYNQDNILDSPQVKALLRQFAWRELDLLPICSLEEFVSQQPENKISAWQKFKSYDPEHPFLRTGES